MLLLTYSLPVRINCTGRTGPSASPGWASVFNRHRTSYLTFDDAKPKMQCSHMNQCKVESENMRYKHINATHNTRLTLRGIAIAFSYILRHAEA